MIGDKDRFEEARLHLNQQVAKAYQVPSVMVGAASLSDRMHAARHGSEFNFDAWEVLPTRDEGLMLWCPACGDVQDVLTVMEMSSSVGRMRELARKHWEGEN